MMLDGIRVLRNATSAAEHRLREGALGGDRDRAAAGAADGEFWGHDADALEVWPQAVTAMTVPAGWYAAARGGE